MSPVVKLLIGLIAALAAGWIAHGPLGRGEALVGALQAQADAAVAKADLPGVSVRMSSAPLARTAILSGPANDIQREGMGSAWGVKDHVASVEGIAGVGWDDEAPPRSLPLLAELLIVVAAAYALGALLGGLFFSRRRRGSYLD